MSRATPKPLRIGGVDIPLGQRVALNLPVANLYTHSELTMPVHVVRGASPGPTLFLSAAVHGDEINGVEIIRRVLRLPILKRIVGTLIAVPVVNVFGFIAHSRYLPDRRDLNRSFPGSDKGSLASRLADLFMREVVANSTHGIDLHTGAIHRSNLPQLRVSLARKGIEPLARAFGAPVILDAELRDGSLRFALTQAGVPVLVFEGGEALRFDETAIRAGLRGVVGVMHELGMVQGPPPKAPRIPPLVSRASTWVRAPQGGIMRMLSQLGTTVQREEVLGVIADPFGENEVEVRAPGAGIVVGRLNLPLVNEGDALVHIAQLDDSRPIAQEIEVLPPEYELPASIDPADGAT